MEPDPAVGCRIKERSAQERSTLGMGPITKHACGIKCTFCVLDLCGELGRSDGAGTGERQCQGKPLGAFPGAQICENAGIGPVRIVLELRVCVCLVLLRERSKFPRRVPSSGE